MSDKSRYPHSDGVEVDPLLFVVIFFVLAICFGVYLVCRLIAALMAAVEVMALSIVGFVFAHPFTTAVLAVSLTVALIVVVIVISFTAFLMDKHAPESGHFKPIETPERTRVEACAAEANDAWWLVLPGAWLIAAIVGAVMSFLTGLFGLIGWLFDDTLASVIQIIPGLAQELDGYPWLAYLIIVLAFVGFTAGSMRQTIWVAWSRSSSVHRDPRRIPLLKLVRTVAWWNRHLPIFNDLAASDDAPDQVKRLESARKQLNDWLVKMEKRLTVAPLGSFPKSSEKIEIQELAGLSTLVEELKHQPVFVAIKAELDDLEHPERIPNPAIAHLASAAAKFFHVRTS